MSLQYSIATLVARGWSGRKIARELGVDRETVRRYRPQPDPKPAIPPTGSQDDSVSKPAIVPTGSKAGRTSQCDPLAEVIAQGLGAGLSAQRIYQDLVTAHQFPGGYDAVKRFVRRLSQRTEPPFRRMESAPGHELQVDFGQGAWVLDQGKRRRPHLFRVVLSHSRKGYSEVVWRQTSESFLRCLENGFRYFGGVTATVVIDNLKAGVLQADWYDPELNPKLEEFARHYGTAILPTKPAMPRHKGKVESGVKFAQNNAVKGRSFASLTAQNAHLADWEKNVADTRIHGTIRQQVGQFFEAVERPALQPLPAGLFPVFEEALRSVHRDGYVEFKKAYYSAPPEYVGRQVWVRQEARLLRLYNPRREQIALHALAEPGRFTTDPAHLHSRKRHIIERGAAYLLDRCRLIGPLTGTWAAAMHQTRGPQSLRVMQGLLQLAEKHPAAAGTSRPPRHASWGLAVARSQTAAGTARQRRAAGLPGDAPLDPFPRCLSHSTRRRPKPQPMIQLQTTLRQLRLSGLLQTLDVRLQEAAAGRLGHGEFLELILQDELNVRHQRMLARRTKAADFRALKTLEDFDLASDN